MKPIFLLTSLVLVACGGSVATEPRAETQPPAKTPDPPPAWSETASCAAIAAACTGDAVMVRGHASGLEGLDGARVEFAVRHIVTAGMGLDVPRGVALGRTRVKGSEFETCTCISEGANNYPQVAAVVYAPGSAGLTGRDVARAMFSQRFATLGDEDVSSALDVEPSDALKEAAVAAMIERTARTTIELASGEAAAVHAGLVADERPIAAQVTAGDATSTSVGLTWHMPGRAWPSERVAFFVDRNENGKCDADGADVGAFVPFASAIKFDGTWLAGASLAPVCGALGLDAPRE